MPRQLFIQNIAPSVPTEQLQTIFSQHGEVIDIQRPINPDNEKPQKFAFIVMETEESAKAVIDNLNGYNLSGQELIIKLAEPKPSNPKTKNRFSAEEQQANQELANQLAEHLGETDHRPRVQILRVVEEMGEEFVMKLYNDAVALRDEGGLLTNDGTRPRSLGGIFFKLAKDRLDPKIRASIFPSWRQLREKKKGKPKSGDRKGGGSHGRGGSKGKSKPRPKPSQLDRISAAKRAKIGATPAPEATPEIIAKYDELKSAEAVAQQKLADIKAKKAKGSPLEALKEVAELKSQIAQLVKSYPSLKKR